MSNWYATFQQCCTHSLQTLCSGVIQRSMNVSPIPVCIVVSALMVWAVSSVAALMGIQDPCVRQVCIYAFCAV